MQLIFDRLRLQLKLNRERNIRQQNAEQYLVEMMDTELRWHRDELLRQARMPLFEFTEVVNKLQSDGLILVKQDGPPKHYSPYYILSNRGLQRARHTMPRS